jgi:hypothetical protein
MAFTFELAADPTAGGQDVDNAKFKIENPNILALSAQAPLPPTSGVGGSGTPYKVTVKATEGVTGEFGFGYFLIDIEESIETSDFTLTQSYTPSPNDSQGEVVGTFSVNAGTGPYTIALVSGTGDTDNGSYQINGMNLEISASNNVTDPTDSIRVSVTDSTGYVVPGTGLPLEKAFVLDVYPLEGTATVACDGTPSTLWDDNVDGDDYCNLEATTTPPP